MCEKSIFHSALPKNCARISPRDSSDFYPVADPSALRPAAVCWLKIKPLNRCLQISLRAYGATCHSKKVSRIHNGRTGQVYVFRPTHFGYRLANWRQEWKSSYQGSSLCFWGALLVILLPIVCWPTSDLWTEGESLVTQPSPRCEAQSHCIPSRVSNRRMSVCRAWASGVPLAFP